MTIRCHYLTHLDAEDGICYQDPTTGVLDRYNPAGTVLFCLERAHKVLADSISGASDRDFAVEFGAYWPGTMYVDLPPNFTGRHARIYWLALMDDAPAVGVGVIAEKDRIAEALLVRHRKISGRKKAESEPCAVMPVDAHLNVYPGDWPPSNLAVFTKWLGHFVRDPEAVVKTVLALDGSRKLLALRAANGCFGAEFIIPPAYQKPEFISRKATFPQTMMRVADKVAVQRFAGFRIDADYVYRRNMHGMKNLSGKKIAVVGCGTIGGFLAHSLAQSGAGTGKGELHLFDRDVLQTPNLGRHLLGVPYLGKPKAEGLRSFLVEQLPHMHVQHHDADVLDQKEQLLRYDLVIDATGEEALSIALNQFFVRNRPKAPPILFVWLVGNGCAAQAIMCIDPDYACMKCLKPELSKPARFPVLKDETVTVRNVACGDATYIPFPVSRSTQAAALAVEMAIDWVNDVPRPYFRTRTFDERKAFRVKDQNPEPSPRCPACGDGA